MKWSREGHAERCLHAHTHIHTVATTEKESVELHKGRRHVLVVFTFRGVFC